MSQITINIGAAANDGTGDPLRTAFNDVNLNFDEVYAAGPVGSNIQIVDNRILTLNTNGNLVLSPNGIGKVVANVDIVPNLSNVRSLGSPTLRWDTVYTKYFNLAGDLTVGGNLVVTGNTINMGDIVTDALTIQLGNTVTTDAAANGAGITVGASDDIATLLYNSTNNEWRTNIGANVAGNVTGQYFIGNGSQLTGVTSYANTNAVAYGEAGWAGNIVPGANLTYSLGNSTNWWSNIWVASNTIYIGGVALGVTGNVLTVNGEAVLSNDSDSDITTTGNITAGVLSADYVQFLDSGSVTESYISETGFIVGSNNSATLATLQAQDVRIITDFNGGSTTWTFGANGALAAPGAITTTGNITADYFIGNGSQLTGLPEQYGNANVAAYLPTYTGNISAGNVIVDTGTAYIEEVVANTLSANSAVVEYLGSGGNIVADGFVQGSELIAQNSIVATGNITAGNISTDGTITANGEVRGQVFALYTPDYYGDLGYSGGNLFMTANAAFKISTDYATNPETGPVWIFDTTGYLDAPGNITTTGNITGNFILADLQVIATGDVTGSNIVGISSVQTANVYATNEVSATGNVIGGNLTTAGQVAATGNITGGNLLASSYRYANGTSILGNFTLTDNTIQTGNGVGGITLSIFGPDQGVPDPAFIMREWTFANTGAFVSPGAISATGNITASANVNAAGGTFTGNITSTANVAITRNLDVTGFIYSGAISGRSGGALNITASNVDVTTGNVNFNTATAVRANVLIASGNITGANLVTAATVFADAVDANSATIDGNLVVDGNVTATADLTLRAGAGGTINFPVSGGNIEFDAATGNVVFPGGVYTGDIATTGTISATGNITGGNIDTDGQITVDALSITNSSIAAATQFTISTSNTATGNSSSVLMDRNGVGVVVQLEDTGGGPYSWGLYQDNILFPDGSRQYSAYGNANVVANLAALGSNPISTTGNVTAGNFIGADANVELVAGSYTWTFDNTGNTAFANGTVTATDITLTGNIDANVGGYNIGYREIPQVTLSANANVALADSGKHFYSTTAGNLSLLIPTNANVAFPTGTAFTIVVQAAGNVLVNADSGVNLYLAGNSTAGNRVVSTYGMATVMKVATDTWFINGTGVA